MSAARTHGWILAVLAVSACTVRNPLYVDDDGGTTGADGGLDLAGDAGDRGDAQMASDDAGACAGGSARACEVQTSGMSKTWISQTCSAGAPKNDRNCPASSECKDGFCQPPPMGMGTVGDPCVGMSGNASENACLNGANVETSCQPFVKSANPVSISWVCAPRVGVGLPGTACTDGAQCRSGFCGGNGTCFRACRTNGDCPMGQMLRCENVTFTVEGVSVTARSCIP